MQPYSEFSEDEIQLKVQQLENEQFLKNLDLVLRRESEEYLRITKNCRMKKKLSILKFKL